MSNDKTGLEEKLLEILDTHYGNIERDKSKRDEVLAKIKFSQAYNLKEEERIARVEFMAMDLPIYGYCQLHAEIKELLNNWLK